MKKGFTLIELLIVMVLVGVLVTVALPKYYASMERGRALEGINNLRAASEYVNSQYIINGNVYPATTALQDKKGYVRGDFTKVVSFSAPVIYSWAAQTIDIVSGRNNGDQYMLKAHNNQGDLQYISCSGPDAASICENIGFEKSGSEYKMDFSK